MSKERLEELAYNVGVSLDGEKSLMSSDDYDFLYNYALEQAERVQELEKRLKIYQKRSWFEDYEKVAKQNKRYRETIEKIKDYNRKALKGNYTENEALLDISLEIRKLEESK